MSERLCKEELACNGHAEGCSIAANGFCPVRKVKKDCLGGGGVFWEMTKYAEYTYCFHTVAACEAAVSYSAFKLGGYGGTYRTPRGIAGAATRAAIIKEISLFFLKF